MSALPKGWVETTLSALTEKLVDGSHNPPPKASTGRPMLSARNIMDGQINFNQYRLIDPDLFEVEHRRSRVTAGDVLLTIVGTIGRSAVVPEGLQEFTLQRSVAVMTPNPAINSFLLSHFFHSADNQRWFEDNAKGTAQKGVYLGALAKLAVPLPPLPEQQRIVAKVDGLMTRTARARKDLAHIPTLITRYKQRLLALAFSGELTADWRVKNDTIGSDLVEVADLCLSITDGDHQAPPRAESGIPFITISAMNNGEINLRKATRFVPQSYFDALKPSRRTAIGDVLFSVTGSIGIPALVKFSDPFVFQRHIAILKPDPKLTSGNFLKLMLASPQVNEQCLAIATGTAQLTVPLSGLRKFTLPFPTLHEQEEIVRRIETAFAWLDRLAAEHTSATKLLPKLDAAILTKAFAGHLVPQNPTDEPASVLLARVKAERAAMPPRAKGRKVALPPITGSVSVTLGGVSVSGTAIVTPPKSRKPTMSKSRSDEDVIGQPYLANLVKQLGGQIEVEILFAQSSLELIDFYRQLSDEYEHGSLSGDKALVRVL